MSTNVDKMANRIIKTKIDQCQPFFDINPFPTREQKEAIAKEVGCQIRQVFRAWEVYRANHPEIYQELTEVGKGVSITDEAEKKLKAKVEETKEVLNKETGKPVLKIPKGIDLIKFAAKFSYPFYPGLFYWQQEMHSKLWMSAKKFLELLVARDSGKSIYLSNLFQWLMDPDAGSEEWDILYLGWTDRRKEVAEYVYNYFKIRGLLQGGKMNSEHHFRLKSGARFDTYLSTSKDTLGKHSIGNFGRVIDEENEVLKHYIRDSADGRKLLICIDDPIDISFMDERHKEEKLERHFDSTIYNINPDRFFFVGTKKFDGDFFTFIEDKFGDRLESYVRGPVVDLPYNVKSLLKFVPDEKAKTAMKISHDEGILLCPERFTRLDVPSFAQDLEGGKKDLDFIRRDVGEYMWSAEYLQNPHPVTGEVWDKVEYEPVMKAWFNYDCCVISLDRATTTNPTSSYTGYTVELRERETEVRLVIADNTGLWEFESLIRHVNAWVLNWHREYPNVDVYLVVEKQGGGDDFISSAKGRNLKFLDYCVLIPVHNVRDKKERIKNYLYSPIKNGNLRFLESLEKSELVKEVLQFPHGLRLDGIDALANAEHQIDVEEVIPPPMRVDEGLDALYDHALRVQLNQARGYSKNDSFDLGDNSNRWDY
jgi:hypothetical protein